METAKIKTSAIAQAEIQRRRRAQRMETAKIKTSAIAQAILGPMLASQPCSHAFWVLTSLHILPFLLKMFFLLFTIYIEYLVLHLLIL